MYDDRKEASEAIYNLVGRAMHPGGGRLNGEGNRIEMGGFTVNVDIRYNSGEGRRLLLTLEGTGVESDSVQVDVDFEAVSDPRSESTRNVAQLIENKVTGLDRVKERLVGNRSEAQSILEAVEGQLGKPFKHADELASAQKDLAGIDQKIRAMQEEEERQKASAQTDGNAQDDVSYSVTKAEVIPIREGVVTSG